MGADLLLFRLPYWTVTKSVFLLWCMLPQFQGSSVMYAKFVRPILRHDRVKEIHEAVRDGAQTGIQTVREQGQAAVWDFSKRVILVRLFFVLFSLLFFILFCFSFPFVFKKEFGRGRFSRF
jgi:hypothetical protein